MCDVMGVPPFARPPSSARALCHLERLSAYQAQSPVVRNAPPTTAENTGAETSPPWCLPALGSSSTTTAASLGSVAGATPPKTAMNLSVEYPPANAFHAVPVLPETRYPGMAARLPVAPSATTTDSSIPINSFAAGGGITRCPDGGVSTRKNDTGRDSPKEPTVAYACASCSAVTEIP